MKKSIVALAFCLSIAPSVIADDVMVERMQSVVDEVSELRLRYEASVKKNSAYALQLKEKDKIIAEFSKEGFDQQNFRDKNIRIQELEFENVKLKESLSGTQSKAKDLQSIKDEREVLEKENQRLNRSAQILLEKNKSLRNQLKSIKAAQQKQTEDNEGLHALQKEIERLKKEKSLLSKTVPPAVICPDDNPFPKLMMKREKEDQAVAIEASDKLIVSETGNVYRIRCEESV